MRGVGIAYEWWREYPNGSLAATVLGFRRRDNVAGGGLELSQDRPHLAPVNGLRVSLADARRRPVQPVTEKSVAARDGDDVFLCMDAIIQGYLQAALSESVERFAAKWATGVMVEPKTGRILAMASVPTFDPNTYNRSQPDQQVNRAIGVPYEPGSAAKPIFAAAAVDAGVMTYQSRIFCENGHYYSRGGGQISDHKSYGHLTLREVVVYSSNIGMAKVGEALGNRRLWTTAVRFGLGTKSGIWLPGESRGLVRPLRQWNGYSLRRVPFGHEISTTALQLTMAFSSLANGGLLLKPRIIDHIRGPGGEIIWRGRREVVRRVLAPSVAAETLSVLQDVVDRGTGKACRMARWTSFGKTGTAQIAGPTGYIEGAYTATFVGGAPASSPKVICLISVYRPDSSRGYYGGTVAAPQVKRVLEQTLWYLGVRPDRPKNLALAG
jgi:cell division protein FtsI/penicillin-binding protein 2